MRKHKFRVWDQRNKEFLIYKKHPVGWHCPTDKESCLVEMWMYVSQDGSAYNELQFCIDSPDFIVTEHTGLKDKNGAEIYKDDIVRMKSCFEGHPDNEYDDSLDRDYTGRVVTLASKGTCLKYPKWVDNDRDNSNGKLNWYKPVSGCNSGIIGNIHENPELAEAQGV